MASTKIWQTGARAELKQALNQHALAARRWVSLEAIEAAAMEAGRIPADKTVVAWLTGEDERRSGSWGTINFSAPLY
jgi:hypothetical protein